MVARQAEGVEGSVIQALVNLPSPRMDEALRTYVGHQPIDFPLALRQHDGYCRALEACSARVRRLDVNRDQPDCVFIEDTAVVLDEVAIVCSMGHESRRAEPGGIEPVLAEYRPVRRIELPATIDGGDVLRVGRTLLVGQTARTNAAAAEALEAIVGPLGYRVLPVPVRGCLHLKSAITALPDGRLLANRAWLDAKAIASFSIVDVPTEEPDAANVALVGGTVIAPAAHPRTVELIRDLGVEVRTVDLGEFAKAEGCVTCLSLIFNAIS